LAVAAAAAGLAVGASGGAAAPTAYVVRSLVSDQPRRAVVLDPGLVNPFGLAASPTGPWWTANEARSSSTLYAGTGAKQALTVAVDGGPTGVVFNGGSGFVVRANEASGPARFIYAGEDGMIRGWSPTVPVGWSKKAVVAVDAAGEGAVFRGLALATLPDGAQRLYATDFHNGKVLVFDARWRRIERRGAFVDPAVPVWYAPYNLVAAGDRLFVTFASPAPVNGNDAPKGGYVDEFDLDGKLVARVAHLGRLNAPWGLALAPRGFGEFGGDLLVGNFGDGHINAFARDSSGRWAYSGTLRDRAGKPLFINGLWGLAFGNGGMAGPAKTLFFTAGPHVWRAETEQSVHGRLGSITPAG
jgi:uncharacterized protein (TIGR03118 family)